MNRRILFVEDDALLRTIYRRQTQGIFESEVVEGSQQALAAIAEGEYAVIVSDLSMPGMDGLALVRLVRQINPRTVLIILSAHADGPLDASADGLLFRVLGKPCPRQQLLSTLEEAVTLWHASTGSEAIVP
jgi:CheY-like chemotaxis protein